MKKKVKRLTNGANLLRIVDQLPKASEEKKDNDLRDFSGYF
jgi:hypothetical protein